MSRTKPTLQQHLLTRADLARLQVPVGDVLAWLGDGAIEQVGELPGEHGGDPVFTVLSPALAHDLAHRLAGIGKTTVVLTPVRVRSFLMRALLAKHGDEAFASHALAEVLHEVAAEVVADADAVSQLAAEEARLEALQAARAGDDAGAAGAPARDDAPREGSKVETHGDVMHAPEDDVVELHDDEACFDADELASAFDLVDIVDESPAGTSESEAEPTSPAAVPAGNEVHDSSDGAPAGIAPPAAAVDPEVDWLAVAATLAALTEATLPTIESEPTASPPDEPGDGAIVAEAASSTIAEPHETDAGAAAEPPLTTADGTAAEPVTPIAQPEEAMSMDSTEALPVEPFSSSACEVVDDAAELAIDEPAAVAAGPVAEADEEPVGASDAEAIASDSAPLAEPKPDQALASDAEAVAVEPAPVAEPKPDQALASDAEAVAVEPAPVAEPKPDQALASDAEAVAVDSAPVAEPKPDQALASDAQAVAVDSAPVAEPKPDPALASDADAVAVDSAPVAEPKPDQALASDAEAVASESERATEPKVEQAIVRDAQAADATVAASAAKGELHGDAEVPLEASATNATSMAIAVSEAVLAGTLARVDTFLANLQRTLVTIVESKVTAESAPASPAPPAPPPPPAPVATTLDVDLEPLVRAIQDSAERAVANAAASREAIAALGSHIDAAGDRLERGVAAALHEAHAREPVVAALPPAPATIAVPPIVVERTDRTPFVLLAFASLVGAWSVVLWWKTGSTQLALGTLVGANLIGCCLLAARRGAT